MYCPCPYKGLYKTAALVGLSDERFRTGLDCSTMSFGLIICGHVVIECWFLRPVQNFTKEDGGQYKVTAKNEMGEGSANITINLEP